MEPILFDDGAAYERFMGLWSQPVGDEFLEWLAPPKGLRWLDVGCGNGAFTERLVARCAPSVVHGIDPSEAQLSFARTRPATASVQYRLGDAMALPFADASFDVAVMPLVIFFVPDPAAGVAEMTRVVRAGGLVTAYAWDMEGGGFPYAALHDQMRALGMMVPAPPNPSASAMDTLREYWTNAGLEAISTRTITVQRTYADFDDYWTTVHMAPSVGSTLRALQSEQSQQLKQVMRAVLPVDAAGHITITARANAVCGSVTTPERSLT
jgi:ubiquinone/menaquinone biosynthesis C-methylase UbiE